MSSCVLTIKNPPKFLQKDYLEKRFEKLGYPKEILTCNFILKDQMPDVIELTFSLPEMCEKFYKNFNDKPLDKLFNYTMEISKEKTEKTNTLTCETEFKFKKNYSNYIETNFEKKKGEEALILINEEEIEGIKKTIMWLIKKVGEAVSKKQSVMNIALPVYILDCRTMLHVFAYELREAPITLNKIYYLKDPIEKLKYMTVVLVSSFHHSLFIVKPFNPIIGETYQIKIGNLNFYLEQTVHKPPTANVYCFDDEGLYKIYGYVATVASTGANSCKAIKSGKMTVEFKDGYKYQIFYPEVYITGTTIGAKGFSLKHYALVLDEASKLISYIKLREDKGFLKSFFSKKKEDSIPDKFEGKIVPSGEVKINTKGRAKHIINKDAQSLCNISGEWTSEIKFDEKVYWKRDSNNLLRFYEMNYKLKSDSSFREDVKALEQGNSNLAQEKKEEYEQRQRDDTKLRELNGYSKEVVKEYIPDDQDSD